MPPYLLGRGWDRRRAWTPRIGQKTLLVLLLAWIVLRALSPPSPGQDRPVIPLWRADLERMVAVDIEEYVKGVVAAEMPADFHLEALKAQAVAARTFALRALETGRRVPGRTDAVLSADPREGQAWTSPEAYRERWGLVGGYVRWRRISRAVEATRGVVLTYQGETIDALYHSTSGGHTESAENYFVGNRPYLVGVPDPYGDHSPVFTSELRVARAEVARRFGLTTVPAAGAGPLASVAERHPSGRVKLALIGGQPFTGRQVRETLGLRSSWFSVVEEDGWITFFVRGNGHGVGMSQYGADGMGRAGASYVEILRYYYRGAQLERRWD